MRESMWAEEEEGEGGEGAVQLDNGTLLQRKQLLHKFLQGCVGRLQVR